MAATGQIPSLKLQNSVIKNIIMTRQESNKILNDASALIFQVEEALSKDLDDPVRKQGYRARVAIGELQNLIRENREKTCIAEEKVNI